jgi:hypothetical protein
MLPERTVEIGREKELPETQATPEIQNRRTINVVAKPENTILQETTHENPQLIHSQDQLSRKR